MFPEVYKKFYAVLAISFVLGLGAMTFLDSTDTVTGFVAQEPIAPETSSFPLGAFFFGLFVGAVAVGLVLLAIHYEHKRL